METDRTQATPASSDGGAKQIHTDDDAQTAAWRAMPMSGLRKLASEAGVEKAILKTIKNGPLPKDALIAALRSALSSTGSVEPAATVVAAVVGETENRGKVGVSDTGAAAEETVMMTEPDLKRQMDELAMTQQQQQHPTEQMKEPELFDESKQPTAEIKQQQQVAPATAATATTTTTAEGGDREFLTCAHSFCR